MVKGDKHKLVSIEFSGNHYFSTELLRGRLQIFKGAFGSAGRFSRRIVESDAQSMRNLYHRQRISGGESRCGDGRQL